MLRILMSLSFVTLLALTVACSVNGSTTQNAEPPVLGCTKDTDCKFDRICYNNSCRDPVINIPPIDSPGEVFEPGGEFEGTGGGDGCDLAAASDPKGVIVDLPLAGDVTITSWPNTPNTETFKSTHAAGTSGECAWDLVAASDKNVYSPIDGKIAAIRSEIPDTCKYSYRCCDKVPCKCLAAPMQKTCDFSDVQACACDSLAALVATSKCPYCASGYGNYVLIERAANDYLLVAHLAANSIPSSLKVGDSVCKGSIIGKMGTTGNSTGAHVHFARTKQTSGSFLSEPLALRYSKNAMDTFDVPRGRQVIKSSLQPTSQCSPQMNWTCDGVAPNVNWQRKASLDEAATPTSVSVVLGNRIHLFGGTNAFRHRVFDTSSNSWSDLAAVPTTIWASGAATVGNGIYGFGDSNMNNKVVRWNGNSWATLGTIPSVRNWHSIGVLGDKVYIIGGLYAYMDKLSVYDSTADTWVDRASLPTPVGASTATAYNGKLYVFGGEPNPRLARSYDPASNAWTDLAPMPGPRYRARSIMFGSQIWVMGGGDLTDGGGGTPQNSTVRYDISAGKWCSGPAMPEPLMWFVSEVVNNKIYLVGGRTSSGGSGTTSVWEGSVM